MPGNASHAFTLDDQHFLLDGKPFQVLAGELHYPRIPREYWRHRLKLARAMGLNTVCTYLFWNAHEPRPGEFDFSGNLDVAAFLQMAQEEGLWAIVRPGPYVCAEWDLGGLPAWLLETPDIRLRCADEKFLEPVRRYISEVGKHLSPLMCQRGGPILMVQLENEYGSYGNDKVYLRHLQQMLVDANLDAQMFTSDGPDRPWLVAGTLPDVPAVANFGSKPEVQMPKLREFRPSGPLMCGEFWAGWFDHWGRGRQGSDYADGIQHGEELRWMIENDVSFNLYMFHGGTNFGFTAGANLYDAYTPTVTSYDYWAAVDEAGRPTAKYRVFRNLLAKHQPSGHVLPDVPPPPAPIIEIPAFELTESACLFDALPDARHAAQPPSMEALGQAHGCVLYRTSIAGLQPGKLRLKEMHDYAQVYLNGHRITTLDRRLHQDSVDITAIPEGEAQLDILVEAMGHVNFGPALIDRKGITERVELAHLTLMQWEVYPLPLDAADLARLRFDAETPAPAPCFHRGQFTLETVGDTFLDMRGWGKGYVWVNGHNLGRFWAIGPQQTLYVPGPWLREGTNEVIVLDLEFAGHRTLAGVTEPILDEVDAPKARNK